MLHTITHTKAANSSSSKHLMLLNGFERALLFAGLGLRFLVSNALLNTLYPYVGDGGMPLLKIHPGTYLIILAVLFASIRLGFLRFLSSQIGQNFLALQFLAMVSAIAAISVWRFGFAGLAYLVDTWVAAILAVMLLKYVKPETLSRLSQFILLLIFVNSIVALAEYADQTQFMPYNNYRFFGAFRSSAILGHPLENSLITSSMLFLVFATPWRMRTQWILVLTFLSAIMAFGARAAFATSMILLVVQQFHTFSSRLLRGRLSFLELGIIPIAMVGAPLLMYMLLFETNLGARIVSLGLLDDSSALARFKIGTIFEFIEPEQLWWGLSQMERTIIVGKNPYFSIVENFWVGLILNFGLVLFIPFVISFLGFLAGLLRGKSGLANYAVLTFLLVASANNSLSTKTPSLIFLVCAIAGIGIAGRIKLSAVQPAMVGRQ